MPNTGSIVLYVAEFDADTSQSPNVCPALVTKVNADGSLNLWVFFYNGSFHKENVVREVLPPGITFIRQTWRPLA